MKFGLHFLLSCVPPRTPRQIYREAIEQCVHGEALGFESAWPVEHHFNQRVSALSCPMLLLAAIAERTERMRLGTAIVQLSLAHPMRVAEEVATLDVLSDGRVELGVGRGSNPAHFVGYGIPMVESHDRFHESISYLRAAFAQERFSFEGKHWRAQQLAVVPRPIQTPHPPIQVATNSAETAIFAGRAGYPAIFAVNVNPFPKIAELFAIYQNARREAGHGAAAPSDVTLLMPTYVAETLEQAREEFEPSVVCASQLASSLMELAIAKSTSDAELAKLMPLLEQLRSIDFEKIRTTMGVVGTPAEVRARFDEIKRDFNPGRIITWFNYGGLVPHDRAMQSMTLFAKTMF